MDDDELMRELAGAGEARTLEEQVAELAKTVADLSKRVAAKEREPKRTVWNWHQATVEQRDEWTGELRAWLNDYLFVQFPWTNHPFKVPACWANHPESVHALAALYQTWQKAYVKQEDPDMAGWWLTKWLDLLISRARRPASLCSPGVCKRVEHPIQELDAPEPEPVPSLAGVVCRRTVHCHLVVSMSPTRTPETSPIRAAVTALKITISPQPR